VLGASIPHQIVELKHSDELWIDDISGFLYTCFRKYSPEWLPNLEASREEVKESFQQNRRSRVLLKGGKVIGWISAFTDKHCWEIHPIAVLPEEHRKGYGKLLVEDISTLAKESGAVSIWAGTGDETNSTSLSNLDLYQCMTKAIENFNAPTDHAANFWLDIGFTLVGVLPDEEGLGKPGLHFARRLSGDT